MWQLCLCLILHGFGSSIHQPFSKYLLQPLYNQNYDVNVFCVLYSSLLKIVSNYKFKLKQ